MCQANKNSFENEKTLICICNFNNFLVIHGFFYKILFFRWFSVILCPMNRLASQNTFCPGKFWMLLNNSKWLVIWPGHVANGPKNRCSNQASLKASNHILIRKTLMELGFWWHQLQGMYLYKVSHFFYFNLLTYFQWREKMLKNILFRKIISFGSSRSLLSSSINQFLIARSIQLENGGFPSTECKNLLYLLDMSSKVYKMNFLDKIDKKYW